LANAIERDLTERERRLLAEATLLLARRGGERSAAAAVAIGCVSVGQPALCRSILPVLYGAWPA
jgi:hypothetical protein